MKKQSKHNYLPNYQTHDEILEFDEWYDKFEDEINIELAEIGADREMDFNPELEFEKRYEKYVINKMF